MLEIKTPLLNELYPLRLDAINLIISESGPYLRELITNIEELGQGELCIYDGTKELSSKDIELVYDIFSLELNETKSLTKLYKELEASTPKDARLLELQGAIAAYIEEVIISSPYNLVAAPSLSLPTLFKLASVTFEPLSSSSSLGENLLEYAKAMKSFGKKRLLILCNLHLYLAPSELALLERELLMLEIYILLLEAREPLVYSPYEEPYLIDEELCMIALDKVARTDEQRLDAIEEVTLLDPSKEAHGASGARLEDGKPSDASIPAFMESPF